MTRSRNDGTFRKPLEDDCLLEGQLHPSIAERMERVRELPISAVANLIGVERDGQGLCMIWRFVEGETLEQFLSGIHSNAQLQDVRQQVERAISAMHAHGIVHGAIHARNVIIDPTGRVILTHVSPLLWNDPQADLRALAGLSAQILPSSGGAEHRDEHKSGSEMALRRRLHISAAGALLAGFLIFIAILWYIRA